MNDQPTPKPDVNEPGQLSPRSCPASGSGAFLAPALGIYITPQSVLDYLAGKPRHDFDAVLANPPFGK